MSFLTLGFLVWNPDPELIRLGPLAIRYYSLLFVGALLGGYQLWMWMSRRHGWDLKIADKWLIWGVVAVVAGSRLGHCFFYEPAYYLSHPLEILMVWKGGLASHGATVGLLLAMWLYARKYRMPYINVLERMSPPTALGALCVRLGNFMNSEIVGRATDVPWAVQFPLHDCPKAAAQGCANLVPRHAAQLYEGMLAAAVLGVLVTVEKWLPVEGRKRGILPGLFLFLYFGGRIYTENFKEFEGQLVMSADGKLPVSAWTMGQYLSIPFALLGLVILVLALLGRFGVHTRPPAPAQAPAVPARQRRKR
jgi:prolipoprotein diacylglyceryl transferase